MLYAVIHHLKGLPFSVLALLGTVVLNIDDEALLAACKAAIVTKEKVTKASFIQLKLILLQCDQQVPNAFLAELPQQVEISSYDVNYSSTLLSFLVIMELFAVENNKVAHLEKAKQVKEEKDVKEDEAEELDEEEDKDEAEDEEEEADKKKEEKEDDEEDQTKQSEEKNQCKGSNPSHDTFQHHNNDCPSSL
ncbi:Heat shock protein hsp-90 [Balamuthia mandrillaris]